MKEVKKCSISGIAFTMDTDAYRTLESYLISLKKTYSEMPEGKEIVEDIEARIAELLLSQGEHTQVVELPLVERIIAQMGSVETICDQSGEGDPAGKESRIPRRLYRDMDNARLGGVCSGIAKYFDISPTMVRLAMFVPLILLMVGWLPLFWWLIPLMGNLFGIFLICYLIMWFVVPPARTARQRLEQSGHPITVQTIRETTAAAGDPDSSAKPVVADVVTVLGKFLLVVFKIVAGVLVFGLILTACALVIGIFVVGMSGPGGSVLLPGIETVGLLVPLLGILVALIPVLLLIYVLMCLIASRKPGGKIVLVVFVFWLLTVVGLAVSAVYQTDHVDWRKNSEWFNDPDMQLPPMEDEDRYSY